MYTICRYKCKDNENVYCTDRSNKIPGQYCNFFVLSRVFLIEKCPVSVCRKLFTLLASSSDSLHVKSPNLPPMFL